MKLIKIVLLVIMLFTLTVAQKIGSWKSYTSMEFVNKAIVSGSNIWAGTEGGAFNFDITDSSYIALTRSDGLSTQDITAINIDSEGKLWIGTKDGIINIYDPRDKSVKKILDISNSGNDQKGINSFFISSDTLFASTDFGVSLINTNTFAFIDTYRKFGSFPSGIKVISTTKSKLIYVCTENGVAIQKEGSTNLSAPESWNVFELGTAINADNVYKISEFGSTLIVSSNNGFFSFDGTTWTSHSFLANNIVDYAVSGDSIIALLDFAVFSYRNNQTNQIELLPGKLNSITLGADSDILVCTDGGIVNVSLPGNPAYFPNGPVSNSFQSLTVDKTGNVWGGSGRSGNGGGLYRFDGINWSNFNSSNVPEIKNNGFHNLYTGPDNIVYGANWGNGFTEISDDNFHTFNTFNTDMLGIVSAPTFLVIYDLRMDSKKNLWALNFESADKKVLNALTPDSVWYHFEIGPPLFPDVVIAEHLVIDGNNTKWFAVTENGSSGRGLYYFNENNTLPDLTDDTWGVLKSGNGLVDDLITALAVDRRGEIWVGTSVGVSIITNPSNPESGIITLFSTIRQQSVTCITVDPLNRKWVGTQQGVFVMSPDGNELIEQFDILNSPLPSNDIKSIAIDENSGLAYIGTDFGLTSVTTAAINPEESFSDLFIYPNPLVINDNPALLTIDGLIRNSEIKILTVSGKLINEFSSPGGRLAQWDGKDLSGNFVPSGIYIVVAFDEEANNVTTAKVAVLRK